LAASPVALVAGSLSPAWLAVVGGRVTVAMALAFATSASAAVVGTAGYRAWVESRPTASAVSASGSGGFARSGGWRWFDFGVESTAVPVRPPPPDVRASRKVEPPPTRSRPFGWVGGGSAGPAGVVPEPSALGLIAVGAAALLRRRRR
jgi:hypothetical protein